MLSGPICSGKYEYGKSSPVKGGNRGLWGEEDKNIRIGGFKTTGGECGERSKVQCNSRSSRPLYGA